MASHCSTYSFPIRLWVKEMTWPGTTRSFLMNLFFRIGTFFQPERRRCQDIFCARLVVIVCFDQSRSRKNFNRRQVCKKIVFRPFFLFLQIFREVQKAFWHFVFHFLFDRSGKLADKSVFWMVSLKTASLKSGFFRRLSVSALMLTCLKNQLS